MKFKLESKEVQVADGGNRAQDYALKYREEGFWPVPVGSRGKVPLADGWPELRLSPEEIRACFLPVYNVGIILGRASGLVDIDLDSNNALKLADHFLPPTPFVFGRASKLRSHRVFRVDEPGKAKQFLGPDKKMIVEYRSDGALTVFPGSVHETGEAIKFTNSEFNMSDRLPVPAPALQGLLLKSVVHLSVASLLLDHWHERQRHALALATAGHLATRGWSHADVSTLFSALIAVAKDEEEADRLLCIVTTFERMARGERVSGRDRLVELVGDEIVKKIDKWTRTIPDTNSSTSFLLTTTNTNNGPVSALLLSSDDDAAATFSKHHRGGLVYCPENEQWFIRKGTVFEPAKASDVQGLVSTFVQGLSAAPNMMMGNHLRTLRSRSRINATVELSRSRLSIPRAKIDSDHHLLGLADGSVLDLRTGECVQTDAIVTKKTGVVFDPDAECPGWMKFLNRIFDGDQALIEFVQRAVGYSLTGYCDEQCLYLLIGKGANGKSTLVLVLQHLFGDYAATTPIQTLMVNRNGNDQTNDLAALVGKRFVSASKANGDKDWPKIKSNS
jgi:putative DNA primase/helicase